MAKPEEVQYYWIKGTDFAAIMNRASLLGLENVQVEFHPDHDGSPMFRVKNTRKALAAEEDDDEFFNFVHPCPPFC